MRWFVRLLLGLCPALGFAAPPDPHVGRHGAYGTLVAELADLLSDRRPVVLGEIHGTVEIPRLVADVLAARMARREPVRLALEIPSSHQPDLEAWLAGGNIVEDRARLFRHRFWGFRDGRSSLAMFELLDGVRRARKAGARIELLAFDVPDPEVSGSTRERVMARQLSAALKERPMATVVLTGNLHARRAIGNPFDPQIELMAWHLRELSPLTLDITAPTGTAWVCAPECGSRAIGRVGASPGTPGLERYGKVSAQGYDGRVTLGRFAASAPADSLLLP